ncbi:hypothetical protein AAFF_G00039320 [Aldrovandia affinis]|uniref:Chemokine interleukin-8-like domain-containing protein n=1 Tax=Aldrovandia affinis TaxID=143900 RepID=A0AAD7S2X6_9TELE|nr:hypothetical protein AAFF_G00039320 [Aldrovandia affinis]
MHLSLTLSQSASLFCVAMLLCAHVSCDPMKLNACCTTTSSYPITTPITGCRLQRASHHCVKAVIFSSEGRYFCSYPRAPWVIAKVRELFKSGARCTF